MKYDIRLISFGIGMIILLTAGGLTAVRGLMALSSINSGSYETLLPDTSTDDPLKYIGNDYKIDGKFITNLPIVLIDTAEPAPDYKEFHEEEEVVIDGVEPYVEGSICVYDSGKGSNKFSEILEKRKQNEPIINDAETGYFQNPMLIKKRGHTSMYFEKAQYLIKTQSQAGEDYDVDYLGMGEGHEWILNGSMADKSLIRNYVAYRIASEIGGNNMSPDSRFCEVISSEPDGTFTYQGVFLLMETISRGKDRVNIEKTKESEDYTSYIVRRDRYTSYDPMLDTYARINGIDEQWIGVKYPGASMLSDKWKNYIEDDFSRTEKIIYSENADIFDVYDKYIDVKSFVDYFLINEFFGNYDAGEHSTYMYKNSGDRLFIGPVWDFDQAMNNYFEAEMDPTILSFQTRPLYKKLTDDVRFMDDLKKRGHELLNTYLSENHVNSVIDEAAAYIRSAREREWYRWAASYVENDPEIRDYDLQGYRDGTIWITRFTDNYDTQLYNIKTYLHKHSKAIETQLSGIRADTHYNTHITVHNAVFFFMVLCLFFVPSILINRKA